MKQTIKLRESELKQMIAESVKGIINEAYGTLPNSSKDVLSKLRNDRPWNPYEPLNKDVVKGEGRKEDRIRVALNSIEETVSDLAGQIEDFAQTNDSAYGKYGGRYGNSEKNSRIANMSNFVKEMRGSVSHLRKVIDMGKNKLIMNLGDQPGKYFDRSSNKFVSDYGIKHNG